jgi:hypothetical protein
MDFITLEVDGSLANRFAAGAVLLWAVLLSCLVLLATYRQLPAIVRVGVLIFGVALAAQTRSVQREIGSLLYSVTSWRVVSVDFWDGPPVDRADGRQHGWVGCLAPTTTRPSKTSV